MLEQMLRPERRKQVQERTESAKIAQRDYKLEISVIVLSGAELVLAIVGIVVERVEGKRTDGCSRQAQPNQCCDCGNSLTAVRQATRGFSRHAEAHT
jgi:hypothetical protein